MKKYFALLCLLLLLVLPAFAAQAEPEGDFVYEVCGGSAEITRYTGSAAALIVPDTLGGCPVVSIGPAAFRGCTSITQLVLPDGIEKLRRYAFEGCTAMEQIVLPQSIEHVDDFVFRACASLKEIRLHDDIDYFNLYAFYGCGADRIVSAGSKTALTISRADNAFCAPEYPHLTLKAYEAAPGKRTFAIDACDPSAAAVSFPDGVTMIENSAFYRCDQLTQLTLPASVDTIGYRAFGSCTALRTITIPNAAAVIDNEAFSACRDLTIIAPAGSDAQAIAQANAENGFIWQPL